MRFVGVYDEAVYPLIASVFQCEIRRASHVEVFADLPPETQARLGNVPQDVWWVDFTPLRNSKILGPFATRTEALDAEKAYLLTHLDHIAPSTRPES